MSIDVFGNSPAMTQDEMIEAGLIDEADELTELGRQLIDEQEQEVMLSAKDDDPGLALRGRRFVAAVRRRSGSEVSLIADPVEVAAERERRRHLSTPDDEALE